MFVFSVYIPYLISRVRPVHSFFEKKSILENYSQIFTNLFFNAYLIVVNPDWACCFCLKNGLFFNRFSKFTKTVKKEADIFTKCAAGFRTGARVWFRTLQSCSRCGKPVPAQEH